MEYEAVGWLGDCLSLEEGSSPLYSAKNKKNNLIICIKNLINIKPVKK